MSTTWINRGHLYAPHVTPVLADCSFTVTPTNGLGITNLTGQAVQNVFMHTSTTPSKGSNGYLNPNPAAGYILVQLADNYTRLYAAHTNMVSPLTGTPVTIGGTAMTAGVAYTITALGTSTAADWIAVGVPRGVIPALGVSFIAIATGSGSGTGSVQAPATAVSNIDHMEVIGTANLSLGPIPVGGSPNFGGWVLLSSQKANALTAPATGTVINLALYLNQSSVAVDNE